MRHWCMASWLSDVIDFDAAPLPESPKELLVLYGRLYSDYKESALMVIDLERHGLNASANIIRVRGQKIMDRWTEVRRRLHKLMGVE
jgi:hypothetical protein